MQILIYGKDTSEMQANIRRILREEAAFDISITDQTPSSGPAEPTLNQAAAMKKSSNPKSMALAFSTLGKKGLSVRARSRLCRIRSSESVPVVSWVELDVGAPAPNVCAHE